LPENADDGDGAKTEPARVLERGDADVRTASGPSPATQIARRVIAEALSTAAAAAAPAEAGGSETARGTVVRVLEIELEPASLGKVTVRMELKDDVLTLRIETTHREATVVIEKERDKLSNALKSAGYIVDAITTQTGEPLRASAQGPLAATGAQSSPFSSTQSQAGLPHSQGGGGQQREAGPGESSPASRGINEGPENPSARSAGALYV
jgi:flagellar hook-length control protein FliK